MRWRFGLLLAANLILLAITIPSIGLTEFALRRPFTQTNPSQDAAMVIANDGAELRATFTTAPAQSHRCLIILHGIASNRRQMPNMHRAFTQAGYNVLLPDSRAHGESGGAQVT